VTRADDALRTGDTTTAVRVYERALWLDPHSTVAADRVAFTLIMQHDRASARQAIDVATQALRATPSDANLLADRAFAQMQLHDWFAARRDFAAAARSARDPRYDHFASRMALRTNDRAAARVYAREALRYDPAFAPARELLRGNR
jgi:Tfp pilus assembly protein PilF